MPFSLVSFLRFSAEDICVHTLLGVWRSTTIKSTAWTARDSCDVSSFVVRFLRSDLWGLKICFPLVFFFLSWLAQSNKYCRENTGNARDTAAAAADHSICPPESRQERAHHVQIAATWGVTRQKIVPSWMRTPVSARSKSPQLRSNTRVC